MSAAFLEDQTSSSQTGLYDRRTFALGDSLQPGNAQALGDIVRQLRRPLRKTGSDLHAIAIHQDFSLVMERISHGCIPFAFSAVLRAQRNHTGAVS